MMKNSLSRPLEATKWKWCERVREQREEKGCELWSEVEGKYIIVLNYEKRQSGRKFVHVGDYTQKTHSLVSTFINLWLHVNALKGGLMYP